MGFKHYDGIGMFQEEQKESNTQERIAIGTELYNLTKTNVYNTLQSIALEIAQEYVEKAAADKDYAPLYGREALMNFFMRIDAKILESQNLQ
jgi:hypothetical protein